MKEFINRVLRPVLIPLSAAAFIGALVYSFSRILLAVPETGSTSLAILLAAEILGVGAVISAAARVKVAQKAVLLVLGLGLVAGGGTAAAIGERQIGEHAEEEVAFTLVAKDIAFDKSAVQAPAGEPFSFRFDNQDPSIPHNVAIYPDAESLSAAETLFQGTIFPGVASMVYAAPALRAGTYYFHCDVHPDMNGSLVAGEGGDGGPSITAKDIAFDTAELQLPADTEVSLAFHNEDPSIPHNVAIYPDAESTSSTDNALFTGEIFPGVATQTYTIPPIPAGEYYFQCDVHPNMNGKAVFG